METLAKKAERAILLKKQIDALEEELKTINQEIAKAIPIEDNKKSGSMVFGNIRAKVQLRENVKWDQEKLAYLMQQYPSEFGFLFKAEYKPVNMKLIYQTTGQVAQAIAACCEIKPATPYVTYEYVESEVTHA